MHLKSIKKANQPFKRSLHAVFETRSICKYMKFQNYGHQSRGELELKKRNLSEGEETLPMQGE